MADPKTIYQPHTSIWLAENGMINIEQEADPVYSRLMPKSPETAEAE